LILFIRNTRGGKIISIITIPY